MIWAAVVMAVREIGRNPLRSVLTTLGIVIGVASVIAMVTLGHATAQRITADIANMGASLLVVSPGGEPRGPTSGVAAAFSEADAVAIAREVTAIASVAPAASRSARIVVGDKNTTSVLTGATNEYFSVRGYRFDRGQPFSEAQLQGGSLACVLGASVRKKLFRSEDPLGTSIRVGSAACLVIGTLASKGESTFGADQDDFVVTPLAAFQHRIAGNENVDSIFVRAVNDRSTRKAKEQIEALMRERRHLETGEENDFLVQDMRQISNALAGVTAAISALLGAIAGISLLVGGIGIMNIMLVSVTERTREIGIRLSIGARGAEVLLQFLVEAITLSTLGGALGVLSGLGLSWGGTALLGLPFTFAPGVVVAAFAFSATVGVAFGFLPARKASRLNPIDALRHE